MFWVQSFNQDDHPWSLIGWDIVNFFSATTQWNSTKLDRKQDFNISSTKFVFRADGRTNMAMLACDWLRHFRLLLYNCWWEFDITCQEACTNVLYQVCILGVDRLTKMAALASDWLRHCQLLPSNCWTEFNETWQKARFQLFHHKVCVFLADLKTKMAALTSDTISISSQQLFHRIQRNLTGS